MKFKIDKASDFDYEEEREFTTLEELLAYINGLKYDDSTLCQAIILGKEGDNWEITIYDNYVE